MAKQTGFNLYVTLSASEVRRRLKGHGFGVKKIESAGKNRAVIMHTATGDHRRKLEGLFRGFVEPSATDENATRNCN